MAKLTNKYLNGTTQLEKVSFDTQAFNNDADMYFLGSEVTNAANEIYAVLKKISAKYNDISDAYKKVIKECGAGEGGKGISDKGAIGKQLRKYQKKCTSRADVMTKRSKQLEKAIQDVYTSSITLGNKQATAVANATDATTSGLVTEEN